MSTKVNNDMEAGIAKWFNYHPVERIGLSKR